MKSSYEEAYLEEIALQADYAARSASQANLFVADHANPAAVFKEMFAFLSHVAAVSRILWPPRIHDPEKKKTAEARGLHLRTTLGIANDHALRNRTLRDHLEHFDERLDRWSQETTHGGIVDLHIGPMSAISGVAISRGDFLRVFEPERGVFTFRGDEFDIQKLASAADGVKVAAVNRMATLRSAARAGSDPQR